MTRFQKTSFAALVAMNVSLLGVVAFDRTRADSPAPASRAAALLDISGRAEAAADLFGSKSDRDTPIVNASRKISPSVVSIHAMISQVAANPFQDFFGPFMPYRGFERQLPSLGSGIVVSAEGHIVTNFHVVENASNIMVSLMDGRVFEAEFLDADPYVDVAVLKINGKNLPAAALGSSGDLMIGEWTLAVGNPFGAFEEDPHPSVSIGVISAVNRFFRPDTVSGDTPRIYQNMIQTDAAINPGNSGGPLVNLDGEVIGLNTFIFSKTGGSQGIGFAIPVERAKAVFNEVLQYGKVRSLWMDFNVRSLAPRLAEQLGMERATQGALIVDMFNDGPAQKSGMEVGDVIVRVDQKLVQDKEDLFAYFLTLHVGDKVEFELLRANKRMKIPYVVGEGR